jgi:thymidylate synthase (FAD)
MINHDIKEAYEQFLDTAEALYRSMIESNVAPEMARMVLPQAAYTEYYVTGSLCAWSRAYKLRSSADAQLEIQTLAQAWNEVISGIDELKHSWSALTS